MVQRELKEPVINKTITIVQDHFNYLKVNTIFQTFCAIYIIDTKGLVVWKAEVLSQNVEM